jgi:hypothetical protein
MFGLGIDERATRRARQWRAIDEISGEVREGRDLYRLAKHCAHEDFNSSLGWVRENPRFIATFMLAYSHTYLVTEAFPKEARENLERFL